MNYIYIFHWSHVNLYVKLMLLLFDNYINIIILCYVGIDYTPHEYEESIRMRLSSFFISNLNYIGSQFIFPITLSIERMGNYMFTFAKSWLYTTNDKNLGIGCLILVGFSGLVGTTSLTLIWLELSQLGSLMFANKANVYQVGVGIDGVIMIFFFVTLVVFWGFGNYFWPIQVGVSGGVFPSLNNFNLWIPVGGLVIAWSFLHKTPYNLKGCYNNWVNN